METITVAHTPTPWELDDRLDEITIHAPWGEHVKPSSSQTYGDYRGALICTVPSQGENAPVVTKQQAFANAEFIVEAVNNYAAHRELLAERDRLKKALDDAHVRNAEDQDEHSEQRATLAKRCEELEGALASKVLGIPTDENTVAWAERAIEAAEVLRLLSEKFNRTDNGHCTVCGGFRLCDTRSNVQPCENKDCLSHRISALKLEAVEQEKLDEIFNNAKAVLAGKGSR